MSRIVEIVSCMSGYDPEALHVEKAREAMRACITPVAATEMVPVRSALGRVLAQDVVPDINVPSHDNSAMDGYAVRFSDLHSSLREIGTALAGKPFTGKVGAGGRKIDAWYAALRVVEVQFDDEADAFRNINTMEELGRS